MSNKLSNVTYGLILSAIGCIPSYAASKDTSCGVQFAISTPPITDEQHVTFTVAGDNGFVESITLSGLSAPQTIENIPCSDFFNITYQISASLHPKTTNPAFIVTPWIWQYKLTAGPLVLNGANSIVSVVFPNDFVCHQPFQSES